MSAFITVLILIGIYGTGIALELPGERKMKDLSIPEIIASGTRIIVDRTTTVSVVIFDHLCVYLRQFIRRLNRKYSKKEKDKVI